MTLVTCQDHNGAKIDAIESRCRDSKDGCRDHGGLVHNNHVILVHGMVDLVGQRAVYGDAESTMKSVRRHLVIKNGVVALGQQGLQEQQLTLRAHGE